MNVARLETDELLLAERLGPRLGQGQARVRRVRHCGRSTRQSRDVDAAQERADVGLRRPSLAPDRGAGDGGRGLLDRLGLGAPGELVARHRGVVPAGRLPPPGLVAIRHRPARRGRS